MFPCGNDYNLYDLGRISRLDLITGLEMCHADPAQHLTKAGDDLYHLCRDLSDLSDLS